MAPFKEHYIHSFIHPFIHSKQRLM